MFLDEFRFRCVEIDKEPVRPGDEYEIIFHSTGRVEVVEKGVLRDVTLEEIRDHIERLTRFYFGKETPVKPTVGPPKA